LLLVDVVISYLHWPHIEVSHLVAVDISQAILYVRVDHQLCQSQDLTTQVKRVPEARFLSLFCSQSLDRLQVEIVIQMQVVQILTMDQQIQHVITLATNLKAGFNPIQRCRLEELCRFKGPE
jgi:hypothetical protein